MRNGPNIGVGWWAAASWGLWNHSKRVGKTRFRTETRAVLRTYLPTLPLVLDRVARLAYLNSELLQSFREKHCATRPTLSVSESVASGILAVSGADQTVQIIELDKAG